MQTTNFKCHHCQQTVQVEPDMAGEVVECPFCGKGIVVPKNLQSSEEIEISREDFARAIEKCRQDPENDAIFLAASASARLFLGLKYYCIVSGKTFLSPEVSSCLADILRELTREDYDYLGKYELDPEIRQWLEDQRQALVDTTAEGLQTTEPDENAFENLTADEEEELRRIGATPEEYKAALKAELLARFIERKIGPRKRP